MQRLSDATARLLNTLFATAESRHGQENAREALERISASGERRAALHLLILLAEGNALMRPVAAAIERLLTGVTPTQLAWLDRHARRWLHGSGGYSLRRWNELTPRDVVTVARAVGEFPSAIGLLASHPDGRVRQTAVLALADTRDGREIPFLMLRANDWVTEVAEAAIVLLEGRLVPGNRGGVLGPLDFILRLETQKRREHVALVSAAKEALLSDEGAEALGRAATFAPQVRRFIYETVWSRAPGEDNRALAAALRDRDVTSRTLAVRWVDTLPDSPAVDRLRHLTRDSAPTIRSLALQLLAARSPSDASARIADALLDGAAGVRALARFLARSLASPLVPRTFYLERLRDRHGPELAAAIEGVGETGTEEDLNAILPLTGAADHRVRGAVLLATARLDASRAVSMATAALSDDQGSRAAALRVLRMHPHLVDVERLADLRRTARGTLLEPKLIGLLARAPKWDAPTLLIDVMRDADEPARVLAATLLAHWCERSTRTQVPPTSIQAAALRDRLQGSLDLPPAVAKELRFALQTAGVR